MPGIGVISNQIKVVIVVIIMALCCLVSTVLSFTFGPKMPVIGDADNKSTLIGSQVCYVLCTIIWFLLVGLTIFVATQG